MTLQRLRFSAMVLLVIGITSSSVHAQCIFNAPGKAKGLKADMVRAMVGCASSITFPAPNSSTTTGTPACAPTTPYSTYEFGSKGTCKVQVQQKAETPCLKMCGFDCANLHVRVACKGIEDGGGMPVSAANDGWSLRVIVRATTDDADGGDMTVIDMPFEFFFDEPSNGKLRLKGDLYSGFFDPCLLGASALSVCTSIEFLTVRIIDPEGNVFATLGASTR